MMEQQETNPFGLASLNFIAEPHSINKEADLLGQPLCNYEVCL